MVLERDGWTCQICGLPLDREASVIDDLYPQVDHILSVAWGGGDELENLRAAHRWCNLALSDGFERNILAEVLITRLERVGYDVDVLLQASPTDVLQAGASLGMDARRQRFAS